jgi:hypothetical protein
VGQGRAPASSQRAAQPAKQQRKHDRQPGGARRQRRPLRRRSGRRVHSLQPPQRPQSAVGSFKGPQRQEQRETPHQSARHVWVRTSARLCLLPSAACTRSPTGAARRCTSTTATCRPPAAAMHSSSASLTKLSRAAARPSCLWMEASSSSRSGEAGLASATTQRSLCPVCPWAHGSADALRHSLLCALDVNAARQLLSGSACSKVSTLMQGISWSQSVQLHPKHATWTANSRLFEQAPDSVASLHRSSDFTSC